MKGMGQIVTWSARDETLHTNSMIKLFHTFLSENPEIKSQDLFEDLTKACSVVVEQEDAFIDKAFELGAVEGLDASSVKKYIRYIANSRLNQLGMDRLYNIGKNPLPYMDEMLNSLEHANFFESRATEYSRAATQGTWEEAFN